MGDNNNNKDGDDKKYCISFADVQQAASRIKGTAHCTPVLTTRTINNINNRQYYFKAEALQKTGSFKFRGALNAIQAAIQQQQQQQSSNNIDLPVVTHSSGNHAQAVALAAKLSCTGQSSSNDDEYNDDNNQNNDTLPTAKVSVTATLCMPDNTPSVKCAAVQAYGGHIILTESTNQAREEAADRVVRETGATFIHPSENPQVIAGQGTVCLEMVQQVREMSSNTNNNNNNNVDLVIIPVGGGGLAAGNCITLRAMLGDKVKIILAEPRQLDDAHRSFYSSTLQAHQPSNTLASVADGLKTTLGPNTWPIIRDHVDDIYTVSELDILKATKLVWERLKVCIEASAGVGVAVALYNQEFAKKYPADKYKKVGIILCGGNVDVLKLTSTMQLMGL